MFTRYRPFLRLSFPHVYFEGATPGSLSVVPDVRTQRLLAKYSLIIRKDSKGYILLAGEVKDRPAPLRTLTGVINLSFKIKNSDPYWINYFNLPFDLGKSRYLYVDNINREDSPESPLTTIDIDGRQVGMQDIIDYRTKVFLLPKSFSKEGVIILRNALDTEITEASYKIQQSGENKILNLTGLPDGKYKLEIDGSNLFVFYTSDVELKPGNLGILNLYVGEVADGEFRIVENEEFKNPHYTLSFGSRSTFWRYFIFDKDNLSIDELEIQAGEIKFDHPAQPPETLGLMDNKWVLESQGDPILLTEKTAGNFELLAYKSANGNGRKLVLKRDLPQADIKNIKPIKIDGVQKIYSDMYVYL